MRTEADYENPYVSRNRNQIVPYSTQISLNNSTQALNQEPEIVEGIALEKEDIISVGLTQEQSRDQIYSEMQKSFCKILPLWAAIFIF